MSIISEAETFFATALTDVEKAATDVQSILSNPAVAAIVPVAQTQITAILTGAGVPVAGVEAAVESIFGMLNALSKVASVANKVPTVVQPAAG